MKIIGVLIAVLVVCSMADNAKTYSPGLDIAVRNTFFEKVKHVIIPKVTETFNKIEVHDKVIENGTYYKVILKEFEGNLLPIKSENVDYEVDEAQNSFMFVFTNLKMNMTALMDCIVMGQDIVGNVILEVNINQFSFEVIPNIRPGNNSVNYFDYTLKELKFEIGDIVVDKASLAFLPEWVTKLILQEFIDFIKGVYSLLETTLETEIKFVIDMAAALIPSSIEIPNTPLSVSLSFPNKAKCKADHIEIPIDGTVFVTKDGYSPDQRQLDPIPVFERDDDNMFQVFLSEYLINTAFKAVGKSGMNYTIFPETIQQLLPDLEEHIFTVRYMSHIFPELLNVYSYDTPVAIMIQVSPQLDTKVTFNKDKVGGYVSPKISILATPNYETAFSFELTFDAIADLTVSSDGKEAMVKAKVDELAIRDEKFTPGTVKEMDLFEILDSWKEMAFKMIEEQVNTLLKDGVKVPVLDIIKGFMDVNIEGLRVRVEEKHIDVTVTTGIQKYQPPMFEFMEEGYATSTEASF